jgi:hypothetical protein
MSYPHLGQRPRRRRDHDRSARATHAANRTSGNTPDAAAGIQSGVTLAETRRPSTSDHSYSLIPSRFLGALRTSASGNPVPG